LALLTPAQWHTLSALLSFTSRDGRRSFTLDQLGVALGVPRAEAEDRLRDLVETRWHDAALLTLEHDATGAVAGASLTSLEVLARIRHDAGVPTAPRQSAAAVEPMPTQLRPALVEVGLQPDQIDHLLRVFPSERIQRQLAWLPEREARNPAALLIRAIEQDWAAPREIA